MIAEVAKRNWMKWLRHVLRKDDGDWVKKIMLYEVDGVRGRGRLRMRWNQVVEKGMREWAD